MAVGAHHQEIDPEPLHHRGDDLVGRARLEMRLDGDPAGRDLRRRRLEQAPRLGLLGADRDEMNGDAGEERRAGDVVHGLQRARPAVEGDEHPPDRPEAAGGDEHGLVRGALYSRYEKFV